MRGNPRAAKEIVMKQRKAVKHVSHEIHHYSNQVNMSVAEIDSSEKEAVKKLVDEGKYTAERARRIVKDISAAKKKRDAALRWHEGESYERKTRTFKKDHSTYSYGSRERAAQHARTATGVYRRTGSAQASQSTRQAAAARSISALAKAAEVQTRKATAVKAAAKSFKAAASRGAKAIGKGFASLGKWMLPFLLIAIPIIIVIGLIMGTVANMSSPVGFFYSNDPVSAVTAQKIVSETQSEWTGKLRELREQYEAQGYKVELLYNDNVYDMGGKVNNWKDVISLYIVTHANRNDETFLVMDDADKTGVRDLYFEMNPISVSTRTELEEKKVQKEVERVVEHVSYVYNRSTQKLERIVTYETTKIVTETVTEEVRYADIFVRNLRYPEVMNKYAVTDVEKKWIDDFLSTDTQKYWDMLGLDLGDSDMFTGDVDIIISNLPTGTLGSAIVQAAFIRLGDPYSMNLRGQGRYVDCSYLTQWAYAQAGISIPGTAAEQARYCVENNKVIDASTAQPGDLIFWSYPNNSRVSGLFMAIGHVAIYVSDGMMIEAAPSAGGVTYRAVSIQGTPAFYARPYV